MASPEERPFLDTNVLFSGLSGSNSPPAVILDRHIEGEIVIVVSRIVLDELEGVIRRKRPAILGKLATFLAETPPDLVADPTRDEVLVAERCINPNDAPILAAAIRSSATCLVSGNTRHFTSDAARCAGISIYTPATYLTTLVM